MEAGDSQERYGLLALVLFVVLQVVRSCLGIVVCNNSDNRCVLVVLQVVPHHVVMMRVFF
jgi:hypothetical protein